MQTSRKWIMNAKCAFGIEMCLWTSISGWEEFQNIEVKNVSLSISDNHVQNIEKKKNSAWIGN